AGEHFVVLFRSRDLAPRLVGPHDQNPLAVGVLLQAAGERNELHDGGRAVDWIRTRLLDLTGDEHFPAVDLLDDDGDARIFDEAPRRVLDGIAQLARREAAGLNVVDERQRDLAVRP